MSGYGGNGGSSGRSYGGGMQAGAFRPLMRARNNGGGYGGGQQPIQQQMQRAYSNPVVARVAYAV